MMVEWWWVLVAFVGGMAFVAVPCLLFALGWLRSWDRAWGMR